MGMPPAKNLYIRLPTAALSASGMSFVKKRILEGRSLITSSQPANTSSPVFIFSAIIHLFLQNTINNAKNTIDNRKI